MMKLSISQEGIEEALRSYVASQGFNFDIANVDFNKTGRGGQTIEAEIELVPAGLAVKPKNQATPRTLEAKPEEVAEESMGFIADPVEEKSVSNTVDAAATSIFGH
jgi:hypothetical protein